MRTLRFVLWGLVLVVGAAVSGVYVGKTFFDDGTALTASPSLSAAFARSRYEDAGGPFTLIDTDGETVTEANFAGTPRAMFFGFTHCPDVCPTALAEASRWLDALGEDADALEVIFVSVDPERDDPASLKRYLSAFDERIVGLTADDPSAIRDVAERYQIAYEKVPLSNGDYTMNHSADTLLFDAQGDYAGFIPYLPPNIRQNETQRLAEEGRTVERLRELVGS